MLNKAPAKWRKTVPCLAEHLKSKKWVSDLALNNVEYVITLVKALLQNFANLLFFLSNLLWVRKKFLFGEIFSLNNEMIIVTIQYTNQYFKSTFNLS